MAFADREHEGVAEASWLAEPLAIAASQHAASKAATRRGQGSGCLGAFVVCAISLVALVMGLFSPAPLHLGDGAFLKDTGLVLALPVVGLALLVLRPLCGWALARRTLERPQVSLALALFGAILGAGALVLLRHPLIHRDQCVFSIGDDNPGVMMAPFLTLALAAGGALGTVGMAWVIERLLRKVPARWVRHTVWAAWIASAALAATSLMAARSRPNPTLGDYLASLPILARLPPPHPGGPPPAAGPWVAVHDDSEHLCEAATVGDLRVRACANYRLSLARPNSASGEGALWASNEEPLTLRRDAAHGLLIVESDGAKHDFVHVFWRRAAFREADLGAIALTARDLRDLAGPPPAWVLSGGLGVALALLALTARRAQLRTLSHPEAWREGRADGAGWIEVPDGPRCAAPAPVAAWAGPVVIVPTGPDRQPTYRSAGTWGEVVVVPGTAEALLAAVRAAEMDRSLLALAALSLTAAPLVAALLEGLVLPFGG
jgi:hypothetical protein